MKVIVGDRRTGRTTKLIEWLLDGMETSGYPYWSRVIVEPNASTVMSTFRMVQMHVEKNNWNPCKKMLPHQPADHNRALVDVYKCVWSLGDLQNNFRSGLKFEYALDNLDGMLAQTGQLACMPHRPSIIVVEGELYAPGN